VNGTTAFICAAVLLVGGRTASAQGVQLLPADPKRWDLSAHAGWVSGNKTELAEEWNDWYDTFAASVEAGRYWTPHFKTEVGGTFTTEGTVFSTGRLVLPTQPAPVFYTVRHHVRLDALTASAAWQFFENTWVHPFLAAGIHVGRERTRTDVPFGPPFDREGRPVPVPLPAETTTVDLEARPFVSGGAKFYVTENGFFRTDLTVVLGSGGASRTHWRAGFGVDF
jgi:hypothetical protein